MLELGLCKCSLQGYAQPSRAWTCSFGHVARLLCTSGSSALCPPSSCCSGYSHVSLPAHSLARTASAEKSRRVPCPAHGCLASARQGTRGYADRELPMLPPRPCSCSPWLALVPSGCAPTYLHYPASADGEFCSFLITYGSVSAIFSAVLHISSPFPSPKQLSISGRFCRVTIIPHFPQNVF